MTGLSFEFTRSIDLSVAKLIWESQKFFEAGRRQLTVAHGVLIFLVSHARLDSSRTAKHRSDPDCLLAGPAWDHSFPNEARPALF
jgi:hypothetical protein